MCFSKDLSPYKDFAHLALRLAVGAIFLYHGSQKWALWSGAPEGMSSGMVTLFKVLSVVEPLGGLALILGVCTQLAASALAVVMIGAITMKLTGVMGPQAMSFQRWELDLILLAANVALIIEGAGTWSVDAKRRM